MTTVIRSLVILILGSLLSHCTSKQITFRTDDRATVIVRDFDGIEGDAKKLGSTPVTIDLDDVTGKVIQLSSPGKRSQYWIIPELMGEANIVKTKLEEDTQSELKLKGTIDQKENLRPKLSRIIRLLLRAYEAIYQKRFKLARNLAGQASQIDPELAAPFVLIGLSYLQDGQRSEARSAFNKAKVLEPDDPAIDQLLEVVK